MAFRGLEASRIMKVVETGRAFLSKSICEVFMKDCFDVLVEKYVHRFLGYGSSKAPFWAIGMEEGGGDSFSIVDNRLRVWKERGEEALEDLVEFHEQLGITRFFGDKPKTQSTWGKLIRILFGFNGWKDDFEKILEFQACRLGRKEDCNICLLELLPLPSRTSENWLYSEFSRLPFLRNRKSYRDAVIEGRIQLLKNAIQEAKPEVVLFYGKKYISYWKRIVGSEFDKADSILFRSGRTLFCCVNHPSAPTKGFTSSKWNEIGRMIRNLKGS